MNALVAFRTQSVGEMMRRLDEARTSAAATRPAASFSAMKAAKAGETEETVTEATTAARNLNQTLDRDAFLQLLVMQMSHQDPLEPVDNTEMLAQLAQFSSLEQMSNLNDSFETLSGNMDQLNFISATSLLGRNITGVDMTGEVRSGTVERVHLDGSIVYLTVDGNLMSMAGVMGIETTNDESDTASDNEGAKGYMPYDQFMRQ